MQPTIEQWCKQSATQPHLYGIFHLTIGTFIQIPRSYLDDRTSSRMSVNTDADWLGEVFWFEKLGNFIIDVQNGYTDFFGIGQRIGWLQRKMKNIYGIANADKDPQTDSLHKA